MSSQENSIPEDVKPNWLKVVRRAQSSCSKNNGLALMTMQVIVSKNNAIIWLSPHLKLLEPSSLSEAEMTPELLAGIVALASENGKL